MKDYSTDFCRWYREKNEQPLKTKAVSGNARKTDHHLYIRDFEYHDEAARLPEKNKDIYNRVLVKGWTVWKRSENLVEFNGCYVYAKQVECPIDKHTAYAYLCYDIDASGDENHKAIKHSRKKRKSECEMHKLFETSGLFVIISPLPYQPDDILTVYYMR